jgi:hypothetical protein
MNWNNIAEKQEAIIEKCAELNGTSVSPMIRDTVRDTITAMQAGKIKEFGGLEAVAVKAIGFFDDDANPLIADIEPEPVEVHKLKRGK